jgi:uracil phosphoribosyltransferase
MEPQCRYISANQYFLSVIYSGESMENALRACCKGIKIGKLLIHRDGDNGKQVKFYDYPIRNSSEYLRITF